MHLGRWTIVLKNFQNSQLENLYHILKQINLSERFKGNKPNINNTIEPIDVLYSMKGRNSILNKI